MKKEIISLDFQTQRMYCPSTGEVVLYLEDISGLS